MARGPLLDPAVLAVWLALALPVIARANSDPLLDLELEALLDTPVASAGLAEQSVRDVAALADVLTADQMRAHGVATLAEAIALLPGLRLQQRQTFLNAYASVSGAAVNDNDNHLLLLVDGVPWRVSTSGGANRLLYDAFPLALVERLELVRGQAAIVHGSNAVSGIVNIVTRDPARAGSRGVLGARDGAALGHVQASWGSDERALTAFVGREWGARDWRQSGLAIATPNGLILPVSGDLVQRADALTLLGRWDGVQMQAFALRSEGVTPSSLQFGLANVSPAIDDSTGLRLQDRRELGSWTLHAALAVDRSRLEYNTLRGHGNRQSMRLALEWPGGDALSGYVGLHAARADGRVSSIVPDWSSREWGAFAQLNGRFADQLNWGIGVQQQRVRDGGSGTTPQASLVWTPGGPWRFKLMRGESFRDADARERFSAAAFQTGHPGLRPEQGRVDALEIAWDGAHSGFVARYFDQRIEDLIVLGPSGPGRLQFTNRGEARIAGSELQWRWAKRGWRLDASWLHLANQRDTQAPRDLGKLQGTWFGESGWVAGLAIEAASESPVASRLQSARQALNPPARGYALMDAHVEFPLGRWLPGLGRATTMSLRLRNAFDRDVWQSTTAPPINTVPYQPGRSWRLAVQLPF